MRAALDALRERPAAWGARPVLLYGFDDLDPLQLDAVETLAGRAEAEVWVALPYEAGPRRVRRPRRHRRAAEAARGPPRRARRPLGALRGARAGALHHLERRLFEGGGEPCPPNGAVRLLEAGGERAEAELVAAEVLELMREGVAPEDIAVLVREGGAAVEVLAAGLADYGVPVAPDARCARRARGSAPGCSRSRARRSRAARRRDVIAWLRTPGKLADPDAADALDARAALGGRHRGRRAAAVGGRADELDALAAAAAEGRPRCWTRCWPRPRRSGPRRTAAARPCSARRRPPTRAHGGRAARRARELRSLAEADPELLAGGPRRCSRRSPRSRSARTRRPPACSSRPRRRSARAASAPCSSAACRRASSRAGRRPSRSSTTTRAPRWRAPGLVLRRHEDVLGEERHLFYACVSRPEEVLFLVVPLLRRGRRPGAAVAVRGRRARAVHRRAVARARHAAAGRGHLAARHGADAARAAARAGGRAARAEPRRWPRRSPGPCSRRWPRAGPRPPAGWRRSPPAACAGWSSRCSPQRAEPDPEPMRKGSLAHAVLETTLRGPEGAHGVGAAGPDTLDAALAELERRSARCARAAAASSRPPAEGGLRALEEDLVRYLRHEAETARGWSRQWLEWSFGREGDSHGALALNGSGYSVTGRVDRIDVDGSGRPMVRDYKGKTVHAGARWAQEDGRCRPRCTRWRRASCSGSSRRRALPADRQGRPAPARVRDRGDARPLRQRRRGRARRRSTPRCWRRARPRSAPRGRCGRAGSGRARRGARRTAAPTPGICRPREPRGAPPEDGRG